VGERARTPDDGQTDRQTDRQTDTSTDNKGRLELSGVREPTKNKGLSGKTVARNKITGMKCKTV